MGFSFLRAPLRRVACVLSVSLVLACGSSDSAGISNGGHGGNAGGGPLGGSGGQPSSSGTAGAGTGGAGGGACTADDEQGCPCPTVGEERPCLSEAAGTCADGVQSCIASNLGGIWGACTPGAPGAEICDGLDNDCDGSVDEDLGTANCGVGECQVSVEACSGGAPTPCQPGNPVPEVCNGLDDDCNGTVDDGFGTVTCGVGECTVVVIACDGGDPPSCVPGQPTAEVCDGLDNDCNGLDDDNIPDLSCGVGACYVVVAACTNGQTQICVPGPASPEICGDNIDNDCDGVVDQGCNCDPAVDADFDGYDECVDCDDSNGAVFPGQTESCNGIDDDCDVLVDETFDGDQDGYSTCSLDPALFDCDDSLASVNPGAPEACGPNDTGNGIDDDCDGYIDETCQPCDPVDDDLDGLSECEGDCDDTDPLVSPGQVEACDGVDTDCNIFTTQNCDVSQPCNFPGDADVCMEDLLCGCVVTNGGQCTGDYVCTSFCQGSFTGELGAGCSPTQSCFYRVTVTDNLHGCAENADPLGSLGAGEVCTGDSDCRSGSCDRYCLGPGCQTKYCVDYCDHHEPDANGSCATGTVCEVVSVSGFNGYMYATCRLDNNGGSQTGDPCAGGCVWGADTCVGGVCAEPCGIESHCPSSYHCSLLGNAVTVGVYGGGSPVYVQGEPAIETVPVCLADSGPGQHDRPAGAACGQNSDCRGEFCEASLGVCVELCTSDSSCPAGLGCELQYVRTPPGSGNGILTARVCMNFTVNALLESL